MTTPPLKEPGRRQAAAEEKRQAILDAGLEVFASNGFAASRLDEVAEKAGVAKGTIYLHFRDKEDLFEQIVMGAVGPVIAQVDAAAERDDVPAAVLIPALFDLFRREVLGTRRKEVARLVLAEGPRFPRIAEFYHREVVGKVIAIVSRVARRAHERGEIASESYARYPQLVMAPLIMALIWDGLFSRIEPLDVEGMLNAHRQLILSAGKEPGA